MPYQSSDAPCTLDIDHVQAPSLGNASRADFEAALGALVQNEMALYQQMQQRSLDRYGIK